MEALLSFYDDEHRHGSFEAGIQASLERLLTDPEFLFRLEPDPPNIQPGVSYQLDDIELASRLSFFLWSSIPDGELLDRAASGKLKDPAVLAQQVRRMLADDRSNALVDNFAIEWLHLPKLRGVAPLPQLFPEFDENLRQSFERETTLFIETQLREDRSVMELLSANYTFVNERLARHYGVPNIYGDRFRKVIFDDQHRGGLLGQGSILTVTSYANRTSPVLRGKWLLDTILGMPPPPPPADVPTLKENTPGSEAVSMRQLMEEHRRNPACAGCHVRMDPLGFALENFDAIGKWRTASDGIPIDASGVFPDGTQFAGVPGLRKLLLSHREEFVQTLTERLLTYALGRDIEYYDLPAVRKIKRDAAKHDYSWSSIIEGIVRSMPFQMSIAKSSQVKAGG